MKVARTLAFVALLCWLAAPYWPVQVDDLYISVAFAREWLATGRLQWSSGKVVEGYSNFLWVLQLIPWLVAGIDPGVGAKVMSWFAGLAYLGVLSSVLPRGRTAWFVLAAVSMWAPFAYWSVLGMETTEYALFASLGWALCARSIDTRGHGVALLAIAALVRPEGTLWVLLGVIGSGVQNGLVRGKGDVGAAGSMLALVGYHVWRVAHFGHLLPTSAVVKLAGAGPMGPGAHELAIELLTAAGVLSSLMLFRLPQRRHWPWILAPFCVHALLVVRMGGDWMGWARMLLPGVLTSVMTTAVVGRLREPDLRGGIVAALVLMGSLLECRASFDGGLAVRPIWRVPNVPTLSMTTPLAADVEWVVENAPEDGVVMTGDVGMVGNIPWVRVRDSAGLVDWRSAEVRGGLRPFVSGEWFDQYGPGPDQICAVRILMRAQTAPTIDDWLVERLPIRALVPGADPPRLWLVASTDGPSRRLINARWRELARRFPAQGWLQWRARVADADEGGPTSADTDFTGGVVPLSWQPGRGFGLFGDGTLESRPLTVIDGERADLQFDVDDPGADGALVHVKIGACGVDLVVREVMNEPVRDLCPTVAAGDRIAVSFLNDTAGDGVDRNVYVDLRRP